VTGSVEEPADSEGEVTAITYPSDARIGCAVGISLVAPYAAINLCSYERYEDGTTSIPDVESFIYRDETERRVDTGGAHREIFSQPAFHTLERSATTLE
jgi:hypothetical protein